MGHTAVGISDPVDAAKTAAVLGAAPVSDSGQNALLVRVVSQLGGGGGAVTQGTSPWVTNDPGLPDSLGQKTMANSTGVVLASDQASVPVAATLAAETTKVIGTVNLAAGANVLGHVISDAGSVVAAAGDAANAASDTGNPVKIGGVAKTANPTAVTDGQRVNALFDKLGKQVVVGALRDKKNVEQTTITSSTAETTIAAAVAAVFVDLYGLVITNTSATVCKVTVKDSNGGTTRFVFEIPATETRGFMLPVDSAVKQATVNTTWTATCGTSVAAIEITALTVQNL